MKTTRANIAEAKARLSELMRRVKRGERIILCDRNKPFAEIRPLRLTPEGRRPFGLGAGTLTVSDDFNEPDPEIQDLFEGRTIT